MVLVIEKEKNLVNGGKTKTKFAFNSLSDALTYAAHWCKRYENTCQGVCEETWKKKVKFGFFTSGEDSGMEHEITFEQIDEYPMP